MPRGKASVAKPAWKTKWPRNGDLKAWLTAMIAKCDAIANHDDAAETALLPIEHLAEIGCVKEALRHVDRFLQRLPKKEVLARVRTAKVGAQICLDAGNLARMEKYLAIAEATEPFNTRKCDKGFSLNSVREFRLENGLLDPEETTNAEQRIKARFWHAKRQFEQATKAGPRTAVAEAVSEMEEAAHKERVEWRRQNFLLQVIYAYAESGDAKGLERAIRRINKRDQHRILSADVLLQLGMKAEAIARAQRDIAAELAELGSSDDPNIHFPVSTICDALRLLAAQGKKAEAKKWLQRVMKEMPSWPAVGLGWTTSAVYRSLAEVTAVAEGKAAARELLAQSMGDAKAEKRSGFRKGAVGAAIELKATLDGIDAAIEDARKLRSPTERRQKLGKLLAKAGRWKELGEVLSEVKSPKEAADAAWWIKFELPGGEVK